MRPRTPHRHRESRRHPSVVAAAVAEEFGLSKRERQVLRHAASGRSIKEIAFQVGVSSRDIEYFWRRIFAKLGCNSQLRVMALLLRRAYSSSGECPSRRARRGVT
jgi:two-component system response regulator FixJ